MLDVFAYQEHAQKKPRNRPRSEPKNALQIVCKTFVAVLAFKVLQLAKNVRLTAADAVDALSERETVRPRYAMQAKYSTSIIVILT